MISKRSRVAVGSTGLIGLVVILVIIRVIGGDDDGSILLASGTVEATEGRLGFEAPGRITAIEVDEGQRVATGDTLAVLDRREALARRAAAEAEIEATRARLDELESGSRPEEIGQARAALDAADERREDARRDLARTRTLFEGGAVSEEAHDKAVTAYEVSASRYAEAEERARLVERGPREETVRAQRARLQSARAALEEVDARLDQMVVTTPFAGIVTVRHREPGEIVIPGTAVVTVLDTNDRWIRIYVPEDRIGAVKLGQAAAITTDTYPDRTYGGAVRFIASEAEFTPKNVQTREERVKLVYRVKVQVIDDPDLDLKPGVPADVRIELDGSP